MVQKILILFCLTYHDSFSINMATTAQTTIRTVQWLVVLVHGTDDTSSFIGTCTYLPLLILFLYWGVVSFF